MATPRIVSVGQCGFDHGSISRFLSSEFGAQVIAARSKTQALEAVRREPVDLVLVNRILDADGTPGLDVIQALQADASLAAVPVMLVSNLADAQAEAVAAGARPGFGKADLGRPIAVERVAAVLANGNADGAEANGRSQPHQ